MIYDFSGDVSIVCSDSDSSNVVGQDVEQYDSYFFEFTLLPLESKLSIIFLHMQIQIRNYQQRGVARPVYEARHHLRVIA